MLGKHETSTFALGRIFWKVPALESSEAADDKNFAPDNCSIAQDDSSFAQDDGSFAQDDIIMLACDDKTSLHMGSVNTRSERKGLVDTNELYIHVLCKLPFGKGVILTLSLHGFLLEKAFDRDQLLAQRSHQQCSLKSVIYLVSLDRGRCQVLLPAQCSNECSTIDHHSNCFKDHVSSELLLGSFIPGIALGINCPRVALGLICLPSCFTHDLSLELL